MSSYQQQEQHTQHDPRVAFHRNHSSLIVAVHFESVVRPVGHAHENLSETQTFAMTTQRRRNASVDVIRQSELPPWRWSCDQCLTPWTHWSPSHSSSSSIGRWPLKTVLKADRCWRIAAEKADAALPTATTHPVVTDERQELPKRGNERHGTRSLTSAHQQPSRPRADGAAPLAVLR